MLCSSGVGDRRATGSSYVSCLYDAISLLRAGGCCVLYILFCSMFLDYWYLRCAGESLWFLLPTISFLERTLSSACTSSSSSYPRWCSGASCWFGFCLARLSSGGYRWLGAFGTSWLDNSSESDYMIFLFFFLSFSPYCCCACLRVGDFWYGDILGCFRCGLLAFGCVDSLVLS